MGKDELSLRENWQEYSGKDANIAEKNFFTILEKSFLGTSFRVRSKPREFKNIYKSITLHPDVLSAIYNPDGQYTHGIIPDYAIDNIDTNKHLYVEVKRQDGWIEGKKMSAGRGNAHERSCKLFTPGLSKIMREAGNLGENALPFWVVFQGDITRDPKRNREVHCWFQGFEEHFFMWRDTNDSSALLNHFNNKLKHLLI